MRPRTFEEWQQLTDLIKAEGKVSLAEAAKEIPAGCRRKFGGRRQHVSTRTVWRWIVFGLNGVRLDGVMLNGEGWHTSKQAITRFQAALAMKAVAGVERAQAMETPRQRETRAEAAGRELEELLA